MTSSPGSRIDLSTVLMAPAAPTVMITFSPVKGSRSALRQPLGDGRADLGKTGVGHVAVAARAVFRHHAPQGRDHRLGRLHVGIAQREVEDVLGAALVAKLDADLEHAADPRSSSICSAIAREMLTARRPAAR